MSRFSLDPSAIKAALFIDCSKSAVDLTALANGMVIAAVIPAPNAAVLAPKPEIDDPALETLLERVSSLDLAPSIILLKLEASPVTRALNV